MNPQLLDEARRRLINDYEFHDSKGAWLQKGRCPECDKKELYTRADAPWVIRCGRENKCGYHEHIREIFPDLFEDWGRRFPQSDTDPNAGADAYLTLQRGFDLALIKGCYHQSYYHSTKLGIGSATVRFDIAPGIYWERLIDRADRFGKKKAHFNYGSNWQGMWWHLPSLTPATAADLWIVEGIFDAIALAHHGIAAVAAFSCNTYPHIALKQLAERCVQEDRPRPRLVWALDGDKAGQKWTLAHRDRAIKEGWDVVAAQIPQRGTKKRDWNDLHQLGLLDEKHLEDYRHHGDLLLAKTVKEKACLMYNRRRESGFTLEFRNRTYWAKLDEENYKQEIKQIETAVADLDGEKKEAKKKDMEWQACVAAIKCQEIASCTAQALYYIANQVTDEAWYYFRVRLPDGREVKSTFTSGQLSGPGEFKKRLIHIAPGAMFTGNLPQLDRILRDQLEGIKTVETVDYTGYSKEHGAYVYGEFAVKDGRLLEMNDEDYFQAGKLSIKSLSSSVHLHVNLTGDGYDTRWIQDVHTAFGLNGLTAVAWWLGSLFAEQIRQRQKSYPFLEIVGEAGAGKTTLLEFLWKLVGRDHEGTDPSKATTAARARIFSQVSNLPVGLIEGDREDDSAKTKQFDWDELKTAYNGRSVRARGIKNGGNETYEPPFRGAIVISQNAAVDASEAIMQRIVHLYFARDKQTADTKAAADRLAQASIETVSHFMLDAILKERAILDTFWQRVPEYERLVMARPDVSIPRIALNHAQMMAMGDALGVLLKLPEQLIELLRQHIGDMAGQRQRDLSADHPVVQQFWDIYDYLNSVDADPVVNHASDAGVIAINLNHFYQVAATAKQQLPEMAALRRHLKSSRTRRFIESNRAVTSKVFKNETGTGRTVRCWVFSNPQSNRRTA
jgi:hypothetical protein